MAILADVKISLRITHTKLDTDITSEIAACKKDLGVAGVVIIDDTDALTAQAIKLYCKWQHNYMGDGEKYEKAYTKLRDSMSLCGDYNEVAVDG